MLILYAKLQYNQINFTIDGHQFPPNLSVDRIVHLIPKLNQLNQIIIKYQIKKYIYLHSQPVNYDRTPNIIIFIF